MKILKKLTSKLFTILLSLTLLSGSIPTYASTLEDTDSIELREAISNGTYPEYCLEKTLNEGDVVIWEETSYLRINESDPSEEPQVITEDEFLNATSENSFSTFGYKPGESITLPDKYNWIKLKVFCTKLATPIHNNNYQFSASYSWKYNPHVIAFKDIFGIASDGNFVFDTSTFSGQAINPSLLSPYGDVVNFTPDSDDVIENTLGVAYKNKLSASSYARIFPMGSLNVLGNPTSSSASIGITYAHSLITGSFDVSIGKDGASISVSPAASFDTITQTAAIDF